MSRRVLILSASVGAGHVRAAEAVAAATRALDPSAVVKTIDVLTLTNPTFRHVYGAAYLDLVNKAPHFLGFFYDLLDQAPKRPNDPGDQLRILVEKLNLGKFIKLLKEDAWDVVVNTHFLPAEIIASLRRDGVISVPQLTATTDFETHRLWVNQPCDLYFTATDEGAAYLAHWGVPADAIRVTGIPIDPVFAAPKPRDACLHNQGLVGDRPIVLQLAGGFGVGPIEELFREILRVERPLEVVVVAGHNAQAKASIEAIAPPPRHRVKVLGFTNQIDELMAVADVVVTKPGGLTTSEVLARGAAMAIVNPIPGQESRNSDYLLEMSAGIKINALALASLKLGRLLDNPARLAQIRANARAIARPRAAFDVAQTALTWPIAPRPVTTVRAPSRHPVDVVAQSVRRRLTKPKREPKG